MSADFSHPNFTFGTAALLRLVADWYYRQSLPVADCGLWESRLDYSLMLGVVLRGYFSGPRESPGLTLALELTRLKPQRRVAYHLDPSALDYLSPLEARGLMEKLYREVTQDEAGNALWPPAPASYQALPESTVPPGTRVRVRVRDPWGHYLPHNRRTGTVVAELDPSTVAQADGWKRRPPAHLYLVHLEKQGRARVPWAMEGDVRTPYADYELSLI